MSNFSQFSLRWNNYFQHVTDAFQSLRIQDDLVDVTLCCNGRKIKAHKVILSACSAYFRETFKENPCKHPVIIFKNVKYEDLNAIVHFMYHGEVTILQEQLESFLMTAEMLEVNGLTDGSDDEEDKNTMTFEKNLTNQPHYKYVNTSLPSVSSESDIHIIEEPINLATSQNFRQIENHLQNTTIVQELPHLQIIGDNNALNNDEFVQLAEVSDNPTPVLGHGSENMQIDNMSSENTEDGLDRSSANESDLAKFRCQLCPKGFKHPTSLTLHKDSHTGKTRCPVCHRSFSRSYDMRSHLQKIHQGKNLTIKEIRYKVANDGVSSKSFINNL